MNSCKIYNYPTLIHVMSEFHEPHDVLASPMTHLFFQYTQQRHNYNYFWGSCFFALFQFPKLRSDENMTKTFIIHTTDVSKQTELFTRLGTNVDFSRYYDGFENTISATTGLAVSFRQYYYKIPQAALTRMVRYLQTTKQDLNVTVRVKICASELGNYNFD